MESINKKKIFNDPVYGFISLPYDIILDVINHPYFQRLRRIKQLGLTDVVYPGALHTRFHHAMGCTHLMGQAIDTLRANGNEITEEEAIGGRIADYLIKPVNPNQILLSLKKNLEGKRLVNEKTTSGYQQEFREIAMDLQDEMDFQEWDNMYRRITRWELKLEKSNDDGMKEILSMQKKEANDLFSRFIENNYLEWLNGTEDAPVMSHTLLQKKVFPHLNKKTFLMVIDNL